LPEITRSASSSKKDFQKNSVKKSNHTNNAKDAIKEINIEKKDSKQCPKNLMVKICGITRETDLKCAESQGSDYIGFINVKRSPRFQTMDQIRGLMAVLNDKKKAVLVLEPEKASEAWNKIIKSGILNIQLHSLDLNELNNLKSKINDFNAKKGDNSEYGVPYSKLSSKINIIRAIGLSDKINDSKKLEIQSFSKICDGLLFDYQIKGISGGTGKQIPLDLVIKASKISRSANKDIKVFLAGGMDIGRMKSEGKIISEYFDVIDFNSSLEDSPGIKNKDKIKDLMTIFKEFNWHC
jgi:phosphoribosylanthranilate isomerase